MKELSIEEKAKRYDKAFIKSRKFLTLCEKCGAKDTVEFIEDIFPELKESEDEKIRKEIIDFIDTKTIDSDERRNKWFSYLEQQSKPININPSEFDSRLNKLLKQFESLPKEELISSLIFYFNVVQNDVTYKEENQCEKPQGKSALDAINEEKVDNQNYVKSSVKGEPKFKVGDWCIDNEDGLIFQIVKVLDKTYRYRTNEGKEYSCARYSLELDARLWNISDAKDGDVLVNGSNTFVFHCINDTRLMGYCHVNINDGRFYDDIGKIECFCLIDAVVNPATKEQCDTLMKAMADAGYTFDFEKKELKKIGQKPTWSEEDESNFQMLIDAINENKHHATDYEHMTYYKLLSWFKSLKDRYVWNPSNEQMATLEYYMHTLIATKHSEVLFGLYQDLKKLREE